MCSSWVKANRLNRSQSKHTHAHHQKAFNFKENKQRCSNGMPTLAWAQELQPVKKQLSGWRVKYLPLELPGVEYWEVSRNFRGVGRFVTSSRGTGEASFTRELKGKNSSSDSPLSPKSTYIPGHAILYSFLSVMNPLDILISSIPPVYFIKQWLSQTSG